CASANRLRAVPESYESELSPSHLLHRIRCGTGRRVSQRLSISSPCESVWRTRRLPPRDLHLAEPAAGLREDLMPLDFPETPVPPNAAESKPARLEVRVRCKRRRWFATAGCGRRQAEPCLSGVPF